MDCVMDEKTKTCRQVWELLPWYVNQTLSAEEMALVEAHCATCPGCQEELAEQMRLAEAMAEMEHLAGSESRCWDALRLQAEADESRAQETPAVGPAEAHHRSTGSWWDRLVRQLHGAIGWLQEQNAGLALGGAAVAALALVILVEPARIDDAPFRTLTSGPTDAPRVLHVEAVAHADEDALHALFADSELVIVDGPSSAGIYVLRQEGHEDLTRVAAGLVVNEDVASVRIRTVQ